MVTLNNYSLEIPEGPEDNGYVSLYHGQQYTIRFRNNSSRQCKITLFIDGEIQGSWIASSFSRDNVIEHASHDNGRFTFYALGSVEGNAVGLTADNPNLGLVTLEVVPEAVPAPTPMSIYKEIVSHPHTAGGTAVGGSYGVSHNTRSVSRSGAGGTGYSGHSSQQFGQARHINVDKSQKVTLHLRLRLRQDEPRPLTNCLLSTPVPPPLH